MVSELKSYVSKANTYEARTGQTDDLVSATLLFLRMAEFISTWDTESYHKISSDVSTGDEDNFNAPMPVMI